MSRRLLIVGSPLYGTNHLVGVDDDVNNFYRYATSSIGGGYTDDEITYLENPSATNVYQALNSNLGNELQTVYFSGHGYRQYETDYICVNEKESLPVNSLFTTSKRHIIIVDACRTPLDTRGYGDIISGLGFHFPTDYLELARKLHWEYISNAPIGGAVIFSTTQNSPSLDTENGGVYTKSLMTALHNWCFTENQKVITVHNAFLRSAAITKKHEPGQIPQINYHRNINAVSIPLGINPKAHVNAVQFPAF